MEMNILYGGRENTNFGFSDTNSARLLIRNIERSEVQMIEILASLVDNDLFVIQTWPLVCSYC